MMANPDVARNMFLIGSPAQSSFRPLLKTSLMPSATKSYKALNVPYPTKH
jgi:hypothetical protein